MKADKLPGVLRDDKLVGVAAPLMQFPRRWLRRAAQSRDHFARSLRVAMLGLCVAFAGLPVHADQSANDAYANRIEGGRRFLPGHTSHAASGKFVAMGRAASTQHLKLAIGLTLRDQAGLEAFIDELNNSDSPNYHKYLTVDEFADRFAPTAADYQAVLDFAAANGLSVTETSPNRLIVNVEGPVAAIEHAFQTTLGYYRHPTENRSFHAPSQEPSVPAGLSILHITGLDDYARPHPALLKLKPLGQPAPMSAAAAPADTVYTGSGPEGLFIGNDFRAAYVPGVSLKGTGQSVALVEFEPYNPSDVKAYFTQAGLPLNVPIQNILLNGATGVMGPDDDDVEAVLDIDMAISMAPALAKVLVYIGDGNTNFLPVTVMNRIATDNTAKQISCSWAWTYDPNERQIFMQYAAQGQTLFAASGDAGAYDITYNGSDYFSFPAEDTFAVAVGGTSLATKSAGGAWQSEVAWSVLSGGGISPDNIPLPSYQQGISNSANKASTALRNAPDVAASADQNMFITATSSGSVVTGAVGGTSAAAPIWAGYIALVNQQAAQNGKTPVGFINPVIYAMGIDSNYTKYFHDVTVGSNVDINNDLNLTSYNAVVGYDLVTGWGSPAGQSLIDALSGTSASAADFKLGSSLASITVVRGSSTTAAISVSPLFGFTGSVSLTVSGLPAGVTASFSPASTKSASTLTLSATSTATTGTSIITVTGKSGSLTHTVTISLVVPSKAPDFSLSLSQSKFGIYRGADPTYENVIVYVTDLNGFAGNVDLSVQGLPSGITPSFSTTTATATAPWSMLYFVAADVPITPGTYNLTITGKSGSLTRTASFKLTVLPPDFEFSIVPGSVTLAPHSSYAADITNSTIDGFSGDVNFSISGLPSGVTAAFGPSSKNANVITFTASSKATAGTTVVTVTGTSGTLTHSIPITVVIEPVVTATTVTTTAGGPWQNVSIPSQTGTFTVTYDATPSDDGMTAEVGLSNGAQTDESGFAVLTRFNPSGYIDAINGGAFSYSKIQYLSGQSHHFRIVVNLSTHTYSAYVSVPFTDAAQEQTIGTDLKFNTAQRNASVINSWGAYSKGGTETVTNFAY